MILMILAASLCLLAAGTAEESGTCGTSLTWTLGDDGTLTISGAGNMSNYTSSSSAPWYAKRSEITAVSIGSEVTSIGSYAFYQCENLTEVTIPSGVERIGDYTFARCTSLVRARIPNTTVNVGNYAFAYCGNLRSVDRACGDL